MVVPLGVGSFETDGTLRGLNQILRTNPTSHGAELVEMDQLPQGEIRFTLAGSSDELDCRRQETASP